MSFEVEGKLVKKYDIEAKTSSFQAREFVIEVESGGYPQFVKFQLVQDRCVLIDAYDEGDAVKVHFDLRGREWQGKYFTNLNAWRIERGSATAPAAGGGGSDASFPSAGDEPAVPASTDDDLPF